MKEDLHKLNIKLFDLEKRYLEGRRAIALGRFRLDKEMLNLKYLIAQEKNEDGKPKYSNETKRTAALNEQLDTDHPLSTLRSQLEEDEHKLNLLGVEIAYLKRKLRVHEIYSRLGTEEVNK